MENNGMKLIIYGQQIYSYLKIRDYSLVSNNERCKRCIGCGNVARILNKHCLNYVGKHSKLFNVPQEIVTCNGWRML